MIIVTRSLFKKSCSLAVSFQNSQSVSQCQSVGNSVSQSVGLSIKWVVVVTTLTYFGCPDLDVYSIESSRPCPSTNFSFLVLQCVITTRYLSLISYDPAPTPSTSIKRQLKRAQITAKRDTIAYNFIKR